MHIHKFPCGSEYHVYALSAVIYKISKNYSQTFKGISLDVKKLFGVRLDDL